MVEMTCEETEEWRAPGLRSRGEKRTDRDDKTSSMSKIRRGEQGGIGMSRKY